MRSTWLVLGFGLLAACASSKQATDCDPAVTTCTCSTNIDCPSGYACAGDGTCQVMTDVDAGVEIDAAPPIDAPPLPGKGFGEPCADKLECESNICILAGTGGFCSETCNAGSCPDGYGCLGVLDSIEPGHVDDVCVPQSTQLCSPCVNHSECAAIGQDLCVTNDLGDAFCARDCSSISCPTGYTCETVDIDGTDYEQCIPNSGYCDCVAENLGMTEPCTIATPAPFNTTCPGVRTCGGDTGWGTCEPPVTSDEPDDAFVDADCDGIDGEVERGVFVASAGNDTGTCGLTATTPCRTIGHGVARAVQSARAHVYVQAGTYNEVVRLASGVSIYGGYNVSWQRGPYSVAGHQVRILGRKDDGSGGTNQYMAIRAHDVATAVKIDNLIIEAPDATEAGKSSYAVHVSAAQVTLTNVQVIGGDGANGVTGTAGLDASSLTPAPGGGKGGAGAEFNTTCNNSARGAGGAGAANTCSSSPSTRVMTGGTGGAGGTMDTNCGVFSLDLDARPGAAGSPASYSPGLPGDPGAGGPANASSCNSGGGTPGGTGRDGEIANGGAGSAGSGGVLAGGFWNANSGTDGSTGENGGGGGGGGGSGGCDDGTDAHGAGGGGGGAGGCAARSGGGGGGGAGGSFGVFAVNNSTVQLASCTIARGNGGTGGAGGAGGRGQPGGVGGLGGDHPGSSPAGSGGRGGHGGHGGGGGGGAGGHSIGIAWTPGSTVNHSCTISGGSAGAGGAGGVSAPAVQGTFEDDGVDGPAGASGVHAETRACPSATSC